MAHQDSFIKLKGRIGDLTFYKTKSGYLAREKGGIDGNRIANDPRFQRPAKMVLNLVGQAALPSC